MEKKKKSPNTCLVVFLTLLGIGIFIFILFYFIGGWGKSSTEITQNTTEATADTAIQETVTTEKVTITETIIAEKTIPDLTAADIKLNLERWGLTSWDSRPIEDSNESFAESKTIDPDTGVELDCLITETDPLSIIHVQFKVDGILVMDNLSSDSFLDVSEGFLGYCATVPYKDSDPEKAKQWIEDNIDKTNDAGKDEIMIINGVVFRLSGVKYMRILSVEPE